VLERGKVGEEYITEELQSRAFSKWTDESFTGQDHPTVIQVFFFFFIIHGFIIIICVNIYTII
jgi:hypothetical protein